jgi:hypothetical protein
VSTALTASTGVHVTPSPVYPGLHVHLNEPTVFVQVAWASQLSVPFEHSFTSLHLDGMPLHCQPLVIAHDAQPSFGSAFASSHCSVPSTTPSPQRTPPPSSPAFPLEPALPLEPAFPLEPALPLEPPAQ